MIRSFGISVLLTLALLVSTAEAQLIRVGPYGGVRAFAPGVRLSVPRPIGPPIFPMPFAVSPFSPFYGPPIPAPVQRYRASRVPAYVPSPSYVVPAAPRFQMEYYGPGGSGSISVGSTPAYPAARAPVAQVDYQAADPLDLESHLYDSATRLTQSLSSRRDGEPWLNYLAPHRITAALERGENTALQELVDHYNGVAANPKLSAITNLDGFAMTRRLLPRYLQKINPQPATVTTESQKPLVNPDHGESLLPLPDSAAPTPAEPGIAVEPGEASEPTPVPEPNAAPEPQAVPEPQPVPEPAFDGPVPAPEVNPADGAGDR